MYECLKDVRNRLKIYDDDTAEDLLRAFLENAETGSEVIDGAKLGIMDYITKPFDPEDLHERIERVFKRLGVLPMEEEELYQRVTAILKDMREQRLFSGKKANALPISESDISVRILYAVDDLANFKRKEAITKLKELQKYDIGNYVRKRTEDVIQMLEEYDEVKAEEKMRALLAELKKRSSAELSESAGVADGKDRMVVTI